MQSETRQDLEPEENGQGGSWSARIGSDGCDSIAAVILVDPDELQAHVPDGFRVRDASHLVDLPAETDKGAFVVSISCREEGANVDIYVERPTVDPPMELAETPHEFYRLGHGRPQDPILDLLIENGAAAEAVNRTFISTTIYALIGFGIVPDLAAHTTFASTNEAHLLDFSLTGSGAGGDLQTAGVEILQESRYWHQAPQGLVVWEQELHDMTMSGQEIPWERYLGALTACSFPEGSIAHRVLGSDSCLGLTAFAMMGHYGLSGTIQYHQGATVTS